jgi:hypothetical protein
MTKRATLLKLPLLVVVFALAPSAWSAEKSSPNTQVSSPVIVFWEGHQHLAPIGLKCPSDHLDISSYSYSKLEVFGNGQADRVEWSLPPCREPAKNLPWTVPVGSKVRRFAVPSQELDNLREFLNQPDVAVLTFFAFDVGWAGDYEIEISRPSGVQKIEVVNLEPNHSGFEHDPTLLRLICMAKRVGGDQSPTWCHDLP